MSGDGRINLGADADREFNTRGAAGGWAVPGFEPRPEARREDASDTTDGPGGGEESAPAGDGAAADRWAAPWASAQPGPRHDDPAGAAGGSRFGQEPSPPTGDAATADQAGAGWAVPGLERRREAGAAVIGGPVWPGLAGAASAEFALIEERLDAYLGIDRLGLDDVRRVADLEAARRLGDRFHVLAAVLAGEADKGGACLRAAGAKTATHLAAGPQMTQREASRLVLEGRRLVRCQPTVEAALAGVVSASQAAQVAREVDQRGRWLAQDQLEQLEDRLLAETAELDAQGLASAAAALVAVIAPAAAEAAEADLVEAEHRRAVAERRLVFNDDGQGSVLFKGRLPEADGRLFAKTVTAHAEALAAAEAATLAEDPTQTRPDRAQRLADGLVAMVESAANHAPRTGGERPRITVTCQLEHLKGGLATAGRLEPDGQPIPPAELRLLACDAGIIPAVMSSPSRLLDLGREARTAPPALRRALELRDGGCSFPGCDTPPERTDVHHVIPFWDPDSQTDVANTVLLCRSHHQLIEPDHLKNADHVEPDPERWELTIEHDTPTFRPPARIDPERKPRHHQRHHLRQLKQTSQQSGRREDDPGPANRRATETTDGGNGPPG
jgi:hypothetical protein